MALGAEDAFGRLLGHGLAQFYSLASFSRPDGSGGKCVVVRQHGKAPSAGGAPSITCGDVLALLREGHPGGHGLSPSALRDAFCHSFDGEARPHLVTATA